MRKKKWLTILGMLVLCLGIGAWLGGCSGSSSSDETAIADLGDMESYQAGQNTKITSKPSDPSSSTSATFKFKCTIKPCTFKCSLDGAAFTACTSPKTYTSLAEGNHTFKVKAKGDKTPASYSWAICIDNDSDGYQDNAACTTGAVDCNDANAAVHPGALEICGNGVDEDCTGGDAACTCGDGECGIGEDIGEANECKEDCPGECGDNVCNEFYEGSEDCAVDCYCGDDVCNRLHPKFENNSWCPQDCPIECGNNVCEPGETAATCCDCPGYCGDGFCNGLCGWDEDQSSCPGDCPCDNDQLCEWWFGENFSNCPTDCLCGNGSCDVSQKCEDLPQADTLTTLTTCTHPVLGALPRWMTWCPQDCPGACGDGHCNPNYESAQSGGPNGCPQDCGCGDDICNQIVDHEQANDPAPAGGDCPSWGYSTPFGTYTGDLCYCPTSYQNPTWDPNSDLLFEVGDCPACGDGVCECGNLCSAISGCAGSPPPLTCEPTTTYFYPPETPFNCPDDCANLVCGDGICSPSIGETTGNCPCDCPGTCGDGYCNPCPNPLFENATICPQDCACGDGICETEYRENLFYLSQEVTFANSSGMYEYGNVVNPSFCPKDCPGQCGDGVCNEYFEGSWTCPHDCYCGDDVCNVLHDYEESYWLLPACWGPDLSDDAVCLDGLCQVDEHNGDSPCPADCFCGDGLCSWDETQANCPADCIASTSVPDDWCFCDVAQDDDWDCAWCGDGFCEIFVYPPESSFNCPVDCPCDGDGVCETGEYDTWYPADVDWCVDCTTCGDSICSVPAENHLTCWQDCP